LSLARKRRPWKHLFWLTPLVALVVVGWRIVVYPIPVHAFANDGSAPAVAGALHVHSVRSDGRGAPEEIAEDARAAGLRFVVITDHNIAPEAPRDLGGVLVLSGTEITTRDGHLLAYDFQGDPPPAGTPAHQADARVRQAGGFTAVAHGHDPKAPWQRWDLRVRGLEIYNAGADARRNLVFPYGNVLAAAFAYPLNPDYALLVLHDRPGDDLARFDAVGRARSIVGYCGLDAHGLPGYARLFRVVRTYLAAELTGDVARDARVVWDALRQGRHHCSFDVFADGSRFRFRAELGSHRAQMGETLTGPEPVRFIVELGIAAAPEAEISLFRNGAIAARAQGTRLEHVTREGGSFRVEVALPVPNLFGGTHRETWILSNAIFVRRK